MAETIASQLDPLVTQGCWKCGIRYAVPDSFIESRTRTGRTIYCPNGHPAAFDKPKPVRVEGNQEISEDRERMRLEILELKAKLDQAEARAQDRESLAEAIPADPEHAEAAPAFPKAVDGVMKCPDCGKPYKSAHCLEKHLYRIHGKEVQS